MEETLPMEEYLPSFFSKGHTEENVGFIDGLGS